MLREQARTIWEAGVAAVASERLVANAIHCDGRSLTILGEPFRLDSLDRILVLGTGKAGAGMASAVEAALGEELTSAKVAGWVNVPADCVRSLRRIVLHAARPAGLNEPTEAGVFGTQRILELAHSAGPNDLVLVLISGGGSALAPAPIPGITLADKQSVTRFLMSSSASIQELNTVRKHLSVFKGGGLAQAAANARAVITLIISDVIGDPLDVIASGPTVPDTTATADALAVLRRFLKQPSDVPASVLAALSQPVGTSAPRFPARCLNHVIGNNATALEAAANKARELGFTVQSLGTNNAGEARVVGQELAEWCRRIRDGQADVAPPICVLSGGEPIVKLTPTTQSRKGGRNQEVALAALQHLWHDGLDRLAILSGGTDGEDGPTDAAGAVVDEALRQAALKRNLNPAEFLSINNSYPFFEQTGGLLRTGPTHTNVMDLRVAVVR
jgi:hydroxypyruvate reductase